MPTIYYSRRSRRAPKHVLSLDIDQRKPRQSWRRLAQDKGFSYYGRDPRNRGNVYLRCFSCNNVMCVHTHVLRTACPECTACWLKAMRQEAIEAGLDFIGPDLEDSHRGLYRASCGHTLNRQRILIQRVGNGDVNVRCETCLEERYADMGRALDWALLGPAAGKRPGYRRYRHQCGYEQDIAIGNLQTGRMTCNGCAANWAADPSNIYLIHFTLPNAGGSYLKLGMSRNVESRLHYQFDLSDGVTAELLDQIAIPSGGQALRLEKGLHKTLRTEHPDWVISRDDLTWICVVSEIYSIDALPHIRVLLADLAAGLRD